MADSWSSFFSYVSQFLKECERDEGTKDVKRAESVCERMEMLIGHLTRISDTIRLELPESGAILLVRKIDDLVKTLSETTLPMWRELQLQQQIPSLPQRNFVHEVHLGKQGRPKLTIDCEQIGFLRQLKFGWTSIANIVGVSRTTLYERRVELDIANNSFSNVS